MQSRWSFRARALALCVLGFTFFLSTAQASEYSLTGPRDLVRERGLPQTQVIKFQAPLPGKYYLLRIHNGPGELHPVKSGWITVNGKKVVNLAELHWRDSRWQQPFDCPFWKSHCRKPQGDGVVEVPLYLELTNELTVRLQGRAGSGLRLEVLSVGDENPYFNEFQVTGPHTLIPLFGWPQEQEIVFEAPVAGAHYLLRLRNGDGNLLPVTSGWVWLNGGELLNPQDFALQQFFCRKGDKKHGNKNWNNYAPWRPGFGMPCEEAREIQLPLTLDLKNTLTIKLFGRWHSGVVVEVVGVDNDLPLISASVDPAANGAGWHRTDTTVTFTCSDALSGVESCSEPVLVSEEGAAQKITGIALDRAGNSAETQVTVSLDKTAPQLTSTIIPPANEAGWHRETATISYYCEDGLSGVAHCPETQRLSTEGADQLVVATAVDIAGNSTELHSAISLDLTPPEIVTSISPPANAAGWHKTSVTLDYQCSDNLSGVADCPQKRVESREGRNREIAVSATDIAGNVASSSVRLSLDTTAPTVSVQLSEPPNTNGWHNAPVTVSYQCSDNLSGIASCPQPMRLAGDGAGQVVSGTAMDIAGNIATFDITINLDQTPPEISFISPADGALLREPRPELKLLLSDNLALDPDSLIVTAVGNAVASCEIAGNIATCTLTEPLSADAEMTLSASVRDLAGNSSETTITTAIDTDGDSVADYADLCADTPGTQTADGDGCAPSQRDSDNDGVSDADEIAAGSDPKDGSSFPPLVIEAFVASPSTIDSKGEPVELRWKVIGAREIVVSSDSGEQTAEGLESQGSLAVNPQITTSYTLTATGPAGEISQSVTVKLDLPPPPERWTAPSIPVQEQIATSLAVADDGSAYVGAFDGNFYKVGPSGQVAWVLEDVGLVMGKAAITGDRIIVGANTGGSGHLESEGRVYALNSEKTILWSFDTAGAVVASPILSADKRNTYITTYSGHIYALDTQSGAQLWHFQLPGEQTIAARPALSGQSLIVHTEEKKVFALDANVQPAGERLLWDRNLE
ncbi:PQQ-binding-like beta-propeller repeat protein [Microbulbifer thermotolerans]|uniref:outer membrane protein assembly factor BamB family protein n=1 Tax=Microbulbifer thermotolerans TaxID=252514 RepID=UPI00224AAFE0|nr:PQQ-binding-like beta-propeller repeat protein [Microbulbifer thermotolerans]MCX2783661.1 PQQ-binding-like beta-propeller repeat protein [Microbulbifer thermotolerans]